MKRRTRLETIDAQKPPDSKKELSRQARSDGRRFVCLSEAAIFTGRTEKAVRKLVERREIPFRRMGRRLVFDLVELEQWIVCQPGVTLEEALQRCADIDGQHACRT